MNQKPVLVMLLSFLALLTAFQTVNAATITTASLDKSAYLAGETGNMLVSIYNDKSEKIRVTELSATIDYYYTGGTPYVQKFFTSETLPDEIQAGETKTYQISISLPTNIAPGYINPRIDAATEIWRPQSSTWGYSDHPSYDNLKLYVESPFKQSYATAQDQLQEQRTVNTNLTNTMYMLAVTTLAFAAVAGFLMFMFFTRKRPLVAQP